MVQFYLLLPPPGNPRDKSSPSGLGMGNCLQQSCPGGTAAVLSRMCRGILGGWRSKSKITSRCSYEVRHFSADTMAPDRVEKTAYFQGKSLEFVADWLS